jgi:hypothetical protein
MYSSPVIGIFGLAGVVLSSMVGVDDGAVWSKISVMMIPLGKILLGLDGVEGFEGVRSGEPAGFQGITTVLPVA